MDVPLLPNRRRSKRIPPPGSERAMRAALSDRLSGRVQPPLAFEGRASVGCSTSSGKLRIQTPCECSSAAMTVHEKPFLHQSRKMSKPSPPSASGRSSREARDMRARTALMSLVSSPYSVQSGPPSLMEGFGCIFPARVADWGVEAAGAREVEATGAWDADVLPGAWDIDVLPEAAFLLSRRSRLCSEISAALLKRRIERRGWSFHQKKERTWRDTSRTR